MDPEQLTGEALVTAHQKLTRNLRIVSMAFPVAFIGLITWNLVSIADLIKSIDGPAVGTEISNRMNALMPDVEHHLADLTDAVEPALFAALATESAALAPQIERRLQADVEQTMDKSKRQLQLGVDRILEDREAAQRAQLLEAFPELADDRATQDAVLAQVRASAKQWSAAQLDTYVAEHLAAIEGLHRTLEASYTKHPSDSADPEDALMALLNLMNEHMGAGDEILAAPGPKQSGKAARAAKKEK